MTWTILILVVAASLYVFAGKLVKTDGKKPSPVAHLIVKSVQVVAIILIVYGLNRNGTGTLYYIKNGLQADMQSQQARDQQVASKEVAKFVKENAADLEKNAQVLGNEKGSKAIYVWSATACPYCRRVHAEFNRILAEDKDVKIVIKNFPVHGEIEDLPSRWFIAAKLQSNAKSAALYELVMNNQYWGDDYQSKDVMKVVAKNLEKYAKQVGLNVDQIKKDMNGSTVAQELSQVRELAQRFNITGTPYIIINGQAFPGAIPYEQIVSALK